MISFTSVTYQALDTACKVTPLHQNCIISTQGMGKYVSIQFGKKRILIAEI